MPAYVVTANNGELGAADNNVRPDEITQDGATNGQALVWSTAGVKWQPGTVGGGTPVWNVLVKTADYPVVAGDVTGLGALISVDSSSGAVTITLPAVSALSAGQQVVVKRNGINQVTVARGATDTIDGSTSLTLDLNLSAFTMVVPASGVDWRVI